MEGYNFESLFQIVETSKGKVPDFKQIETQDAEIEKLQQAILEINSQEPFTYSTTFR